MLTSVERFHQNLDRARVAFYDDRSGWMICLAVLGITIVRSGVTYSFGMFIVQLEKVYHAPLAEQNWIGTLSFCISLSFAPLSVVGIRRFGHSGYRIGGICGTVMLFVSCMCSSLVTSLEWMFLTHSFLYGVGSSLIYMSSSLVIGEYFDKEHKYHVMATSILLCGYPIGSLLFNPLNAWILTCYGWRVAFRIAGFMILFTGFPCCWAFVSKAEVRRHRILNEERDREEMDANSTKSYDHELEGRAAADAEEDPEPEPPSTQCPQCCTFQDVKARPEIVLWYLGNCISYLGFYMPFVNLAYYMKLKGFHATRSSFAITLLSFAECITYIVASFFGDYLKGRLVVVNTISAGALAVICIVWPFFDVNFPMILIISVAMGGFLGLTIVYSYAAAGEVTEQPMDVAWPYTNLWSGIGILLGPFFSGAIFDLRKSYDDVFYVVGAIYALDVLVFGSIHVIKRFRNTTASSNLLPESTGYEEFDAREVGGELVSARLEHRMKSLKGGGAKGVGITSGILCGQTSSTHAYGTLDTSTAVSADSR